MTKAKKAKNGGERKRPDGGERKKRTTLDLTARVEATSAKQRKGSLGEQMQALVAHKPTVQTVLDKIKTEIKTPRGGTHPSMVILKATLQRGAVKLA